MRKNFLDNIVGFMKLRQEELQIYNQFVYDGLPLVPCIEKNANFLMISLDDTFINLS